MTRGNLRKRDIDGFRYSGSGTNSDVRWDGAVPGFGVRVYPSGRKAYLFAYRIGGRKRWMTLGDVGVLPLEKARGAASDARNAVRGGIDPQEQRRGLAERKTVGELVDTYIERHAKPLKKTWKKDQSRLRRHIPKRWRARPAAGITFDDIDGLHKDIGARTPYEANRVIEIMRIMFNLGAKWGFTAPEAVNPAKGIKRFPEKARKRIVRPNDLPGLAAAIDKEPSVHIRAALWLYILTGARKMELLATKRSDVDWRNATIRLPDTKSGEEQCLILSAPALAILQAVPELEGNPYLFPSPRKKGGHLVNIEKAWHRVRDAAGIPDVWVHDLRRTVGSWLGSSGVDLTRIKDALRHANVATTLTYVRLADDDVREAIEAHGQRVMDIAGKRVHKGGGG